MNSLIVRNKSTTSASTQRGILYGYMGISGVNAITYSYNGFQWYAVSSSSSKLSFGTGTATLYDCNGIEYNGSMWVAQGQRNASGNTSGYSYDGKTWVLSTSVIPSSTSGYVGQSGGVFWASSISKWFIWGTSPTQYYQLHYSTNGINWTDSNINIANPPRNMIYANNKLVITQTGYGISSSSDGITWTLHGNPAGSETYWIDYSPSLGIYVAACLTTPFLWWATSLTGPWTASTGGIFTTNTASSHQILWVPFANIFVAAGTGTNYMGWSTDGKAWTGLGLVIPFTSSPYRLKCTDNIIIASNDGVAISYNGKIWTKPTPSSITVASSVGWNNIPLEQPDLIVSAGIGAYGLAYSFNGGMTWTGVTASLLTTAGSTVAYNGSSTSPLWLAGGIGPTYNMVYSTNGIVWTGIASTFSTSCNSIAYSAQLGRWTAVGQGTNTIMYSTGGTSGWTATSLNAFSGNGGQSIVWNGAMFLAVGIGNLYDVATSPDGITWTGQKVFEGGSAYGGYSACWNGSIWIIGGSTNQVTSMYYSTNSAGTAWQPVVSTNPIFTTCYSIAWNGAIYVAVGAPASNAITNTIAYSYDGTTWTGITGTTIFSTSGYNVIWTGTKFLASGSGSTNYFAYSITGYNGWTGLGKGAFTTSANALCWNKVAPDKIMVACSSGTNKLAYSNDGKNWTGLGATIFTTNCQGIAYNGAIWVACGALTNTMAYSYDGMNWTGIAAASAFLNMGYSAAYSQQLALWVAVGQGTHSIMYSTNGITWTGITAKTIFGTYGYSVVWNDLMFVAVGNGTYTIAYSYDGKNWTVIPTSTSTSFPVYGFGLCWNGSLWVATGGASGGGNAILTSTTGTSWTPVAGSSTLFSQCVTVAWNGTMFVAGGASSTNTLAYSTNGTTWTGVTGLTVFSSYVYGVLWNSSLSLWIATGTGTGNTLAYSTDGINWTGLGISTFNTGGNRISSNIQEVVGQIAYTEPIATPTSPFFVAGGQGGNTLAYSVDCITWTGLGAVTFTTVCNQVAYNGSSIYVAVGQGGNTIAYSSDGLFWTGVVSSPFSTAGTSVEYSPGLNRWLAAGSGGSTLAWSSDGISWTGLLTSTFNTSGSCVKWIPQLSLFLGGGSGGNTIAYSSDGWSWTGFGSTVFTTNCNAFSYNGSILVAGGSGGNTLATSTSNPPSFSAVASSASYISTSCQGLGWNGTIFVASGQGSSGATSLATSPDGTTWTSVTSPFTGAGSMSNNIIWNGLYWSLTGKSAGNTLAYSVNGSTWYGQGISIFSVQGLGICSNGVTATTNNVSVITGMDASNSITVYSFDAINYTPISDASYISILAYNGLMWIGYISSTQLAYSTNLTNWTHITCPFFTASSYAIAIAWSPSLQIWVGIVRLATTNSIGWSTDGINWNNSKALNTLFASGPYAIEWISSVNMFIAGGTGNGIAYSVDGKTWTGCGVSAIIPQMRGVCANNNIIVGVGGPGATNMVLSTNGTTWITDPSFTNTIFGTNAYIQNVSWNGQMFVCAGSYTTTTVGVIASSPDGYTWTRRNNTVFTTNGASDTLWINSLSLWVVLGGSATNKMATSPDGINWTGKGLQYQIILYNGVLSTYNTNNRTMLVAVGAGTNSLAYSFDGVHWNGLGLSIFSTSAIGIAYNGKMWVAVGEGTNTIAYSYNGINWIGLGNIIFSGGTGTGIKWSPKLGIWVATGSGGNALAYSTNGTVWTGYGAIMFTTGIDVVWSPQLNIFVSVGTAAGNTLATSSTGTTWTPVTSSRTIFSNIGKGVCWNGTIFIAAGIGGNSIATSPNGTTWTGTAGSVSLFTSGGWGVNCNGQLTVALGQGANTLAYSSNGGTSWTGLGLGIFSTWGSQVKWVNSLSMWVASGQGGNSIATSPNGTTWTGLGLGIFSTNGFEIEWNGI